MSLPGNDAGDPSRAAKPTQGPAFLSHLTPDVVAAWVAVGLLGLATLWAFWTTLGQLADRWSSDPQYSHGFLVPVFAIVILWLRMPETVAWKPSVWGLPVLAVSLAPRWFSARMDLAHVDGLCMIGALLGVALLVGGWQVLRWTAPAIVFLAFMVPLPDSVEYGIAVPLRRIATLISTYILQTFGYPAIAEGNIIQIEHIRMGVIEACSGLGMLMTFLALATAMAIVVPGPRFDRLVLIASAIPIAVFANVLRITLTGMAFYSLGWEEHRELIHDALGWFMMPLALVLLWLELKFMRLLLVSTGDDAPLTLPLSPWVERARSTPSKPRWS